MFDTVSCAVALMGYSGELAQQKVQQQDAGTGSLRVYLIDALSTMTAEKLNGGIKIEER